MVSAEQSQARPEASPLFAHSRFAVTALETAAVLRVCDQQVLNLVADRALVGFSVGAGASSERQHLRLVRGGVDAFFMERFLLQNGVEYPAENSLLVRLLRQQLRALEGGSSRHVLN
jgi:hypothetical protein